MKKTAKVIISLTLTLVMSLATLIPAYAANLPEVETKAAALKQLGLFTWIV